MIKSETHLCFRPVEIGDYDKLYPFTSEYGEGSCQHSPVTFCSLIEKYHDEFCINDNVLYILRNGLCDDTYRVYLAPFTGTDLKTAFSVIIEDAASYNKKAAFISLTEKNAKILDTSFQGQFNIKENRDLAEYVYRCDMMANYSGHSLSKRRQQVRAFWRTFGERAQIDIITEKDFEDILRFENDWLNQNIETHDKIALEREERMIKSQFDHFFDLNLSGIVLRIDGIVRGFGYGTKLNDYYYDAIVEKGDYNILHIYKVLRQESVKRCALDCRYVNLEEDVGVEGLRKVKLSYKPEYLLRKFVAFQK
ncbi:MAG: phosphatidylglycerol lysyltransferase domain-containing protein [Lachnospiraceae bacterium]|nr:phosphatidylglycerol lysyltransferase domain-containing protein [Lachnospiraceae bacterium]